jgi:hypothetical protein
MKIKTILTGHRNDFSAIIECEHCLSTAHLATGYHDNFYHTQVLPSMFCPVCGKNRRGQIEQRKEPAEGTP